LLLFVDPGAAARSAGGSAPDFDPLVGCNLRPLTRTGCDQLIAAVTTAVADRQASVRSLRANGGPVECLASGSPCPPPASGSWLGSVLADVGGARPIGFDVAQVDGAIVVTEVPYPITSAIPSSTVLGSVLVPGGIKPMKVVMVGHPGVVRAWRATTETEFEAHAQLAERDIALTAVDRQHSVLAWVGGACDVSATLSIRPTQLVLTEDPHRACDAVGIGKGLVLSFASSGDAAALHVSLVRGAILP
jgi:hypothetical protein